VCSSVCVAGGIPPNALQHTEAYCANSAFWFPRLSPEAVHVKWRERPLSAKGGTIGQKWPVKFSLTNATFTSLYDSLTCAKLRHGTDGFTSPPKECMLMIFSSEKFEGLGRVWTRKLVYQRPACQPLDHRSRLMCVFVCSEYNLHVL
jgi:hypothetical protein